MELLLPSFKIYSLVSSLSLSSLKRLRFDLDSPEAVVVREGVGLIAPSAEEESERDASPAPLGLGVDVAEMLRK